MEIRYFANNASTTLVSDGGATISVSSTALFPSQYPFNVTLENTALTKEIVKVTGLASAGVWNVVRAQEGTVQTTFTSGSKVEQRITAGTLNSIIKDKAELAGANFTGNVAVSSTPGTTGSVALWTGDNTHTGYVRFALPNDTRLGYIGYAESSYFTIATESNVNLNFSVNGYPYAAKMVYLGSGLPKMYLDGNKDVPRRYPSGSVLPASDIGPIWHDDYNTWMTWQTFNANGASYTGYASYNVGQLIPDGQASQRTGRLRSGGYYSKTAYAAIWNWALHNGLVVALGSWMQGMWAFADNGDGTFRTPDIRGEFIRIYDDGRGVDTERTNFRNWQGWQLQAHTHGSGGYHTGSGSLVFSGVGLSNAGDVVYSQTQSTGGTTNGSENRVRNFAQYGSIQF